MASRDLSQTVDAATPQGALLFNEDEPTDLNRMSFAGLERLRQEAQPVGLINDEGNPRNVQLDTCIDLEDLACVMLLKLMPEDRDSWPERYKVSDRDRLGFQRVMRRIIDAYQPTSAQIEAYFWGPPDEEPAE